MRVPELLEDVGLALEAGHGSFVAEKSEGDDLECDWMNLAIAIKLGSINGPHCAATEFLLDGETIRTRTDGLTDQHVHPPHRIPALLLIVLSI